MATDAYKPPTPPTPPTNTPSLQSFHRALLPRSLSYRIALKPHRNVNNSSSSPALFMHDEGDRGNLRMFSKSCWPDLKPRSCNQLHRGGNLMTATIPERDAVVSAGTYRLPGRAPTPLEERRLTIGAGIAQRYCDNMSCNYVLCAPPPKNTSDHCAIHPC